MFRLFSLSDHIIAVSNWLQYALYLNGVPQSKISLCRHGLPPELIKIRTNYVFKISDPIRIGFIGRFNHVKGVHILIKAFKKLPLNKRVELRLYGRANLEEEEIYLRQLKKLSHNDKRILFCGELTSENREEVLNTIDVLAVPSIWFETGPFVVLEAFAAGIPVIGSNLGGIGELVVDKVNGLLVKTGDVRAWTAALRWVCEYPKSVMDWRSHIPVVRTVKEVVSDMSRIYEALLVKKEK